MDPNLNPNDNNGGALVATCIAFLVLTWFSVLIRFYTRIFITKSFQGDDWLMAVSQVGNDPVQVAGSRTDTGLDYLHHVGFLHPSGSGNRPRQA